MIDQDTLHYFFSAWLQADAALMALSGVWFVYRLQSNENTINHSRIWLLNYGDQIVNENTVDKFERAKTKGRLEIIAYYRKEGHLGIARRFDLWHSSLKGILRIKSSIVPSMGLLLGGVLLSSLFLLFSVPLSKSDK